MPVATDDHRAPSLPDRGRPDAPEPHPLLKPNLTRQNSMPLRVNASLISMRILVTAAILGAFAFGQTKIASVEGITEYKLDNGLNVLLFPDNSKPTVTVNIPYRVGSRHEGYGESGMAHLLEHMLFKGTEKRKEVVPELRAHGATFNGSTYFDRTNYFETMPATEENLRFALELEADRMIHSRV